MANEPRAHGDIDAGGHGEPLTLSSVHDAEQLVCARGALFLVTERHGDIAPAGARELGLFHQDTRYLSHLELNVANVEIVFLSAETSHDAFNQVDLMASGKHVVEGLDDPQGFLHIRRRQLLDRGLVEECTLTSFLSQPIDLRVELRFDADFADIFEVRGAKRERRGRRGPIHVGTDTVTYCYDGLDGIRYASEIVLDPRPTQLGEHSASFDISLPAGGSQQIELSVTPHRSAVHGSLGRIAFDHRIERLLQQASDFREDSTRVRCNDAVLDRVFDRAVADLAALRMEVGPSNILAAGIPWYCCPFGRDSLLASYEALLLNPELAAQSLRVLAAFQGKREDPRTEEEPGKIFHELRFGEMINTEEMPHAPYYGSADATALFVVVLDAVHRVSGELDLVRELREALLAALAFIDRASEHGTRLVTYARRSPKGLDNQGWKDSRSGVSYPDGKWVKPPIALCEIQGYCADAYARGANLLRALGEGVLAETYAVRAAAMHALIQERMWLPEHGRYAFAIDGDGQTVPTVVSNLGHLLWSRVVTPERAASTAALLLSPASFSGFGIRTLATGQAVYNPLSYHNGTVWPHDNAIVAQGFASYGDTRSAAKVFDGMIRAMAFFRDRRLPELFCGMPERSGNLVRYPVACSPQAWASAAPFLLLQAALGLDLDAPQRTLGIHNACLPASLDWVEIERMRVGHSRVSLRLRRDGQRVHIERLDIQGPPLRTRIEIE